MMRERPGQFQFPGCVRELFVYPWTVTVFEDSSARNASSDAFHDLRHFLEGGHGSVSRGGHGQRAMRGAALDRPLRVMACQETVNQAGSKGIAASDAIEDFEVLAVSCLVELAIAITDRAPIILRGRFCFAKPALPAS